MQTYRNGQVYLQVNLLFITKILKIILIEPAVNNHYSSSNYLYLPDPKDGSLYMSDPNRGSVKKLPFTIPELVQISPTQTSDGLLYSGELWFFFV
jgi:hypothetical protein